MKGTITHIRPEEHERTAPSGTHGRVGQPLTAPTSTAVRTPRLLAPRAATPANVDAAPLTRQPKKPSFCASGFRLRREGPAKPGDERGLTPLVTALVERPRAAEVLEPTDHADVPVAFQGTRTVEELEARALLGPGQTPRRPIVVRALRSLHAPSCAPGA